MIELRPSLLPKLAQCACFESSPCSSDAAERGTRMDEATRKLLCGEIRENQVKDMLKADEAEAVLWTVRTIKAICGVAPIIADKAGCTMAKWHPNVTGGEQDCRCPELQISFDFKSGQMRSYLEQQACYAVAEMEASFADKWTCYLVFSDQQEVVKYEFTYQQAKDIVQGVLEAQMTPEPNICEYCSWCAKCDGCPARTKLASSTLAVGAAMDLDTWFESIKDSPVMLSEFLTGASVISDFEKKGKARALELINSGVDVPGFVRRSRKGSEMVDPETVGHYIQRLGFSAVLAEYGNLSGAKFRKLWQEKLPSDPFPEDKVTTGAGSSFVVKVPVKKIK